MKIKNLSDDFYYEELEEILKEKGIIKDEKIFIGFKFDDMTFKSVEELNKFIDDHCICLSDENYTYFVYKRSAIDENIEFPEDYYVDRVENENIDFPMKE